LSENNGYVYVKLGGSFLTYKDRPFSVNYDALSKAVEILYRVSGKVKLILGNGGGSFAHYVVKTHRDQPVEFILPACQESTRRLNTIVVNTFVNHGLRVVGIQTSGVIVEGADGYVIFTKPIELALKNNITPILHGECIYSEIAGYRVISTESVFRILSKYFKPVRVVLLTDIPGIYTCDPKKCESAELIPRIDQGSLDSVLEMLKASSSVDATGGIYGKVISMAELSRELKVKVAVVSGFDVESATKAILGFSDFRGTLIDMAG